VLQSSNPEEQEDQLRYIRRLGQYCQVEITARIEPGWDRRWIDVAKESKNHVRIDGLIISQRGEVEDDSANTLTKDVILDYMQELPNVDGVRTVVVEQLNDKSIILEVVNILKRLPNLRLLHLLISDEMVPFIDSMIQACLTLHQLLIHDEWEDAAALTAGQISELQKAVAKQTELQRLDLNVELGWPGARDLVKTALNIPTLRHLDLAHYGISEQETEALVELVSGRPDLEFQIY
jgi:hypothetical protein